MSHSDHLFIDVDSELISAIFCLSCNCLNDPTHLICQRCGKPLTGEISYIRSTLERISYTNQRRRERKQQPSTFHQNEDVSTTDLQDYIEQVVLVNPSTRDIRYYLERIREQSKSDSRVYREQSECLFPMTNLELLFIFLCFGLPLIAFTILALR